VAVAVIAIPAELNIDLGHPEVLSLSRGAADNNGAGISTAAIARVRAIFIMGLLLPFSDLNSQLSRAKDDCWP
jgi:hypothetical protein